MDSFFLQARHASPVHMAAFTVVALVIVGLFALAIWLISKDPPEQL